MDIILHQNTEGLLHITNFLPCKTTRSRQKLSSQSTNSYSVKKCTLAKYNHQTFFWPQKTRLDFQYSLMRHFSSSKAKSALKMSLNLLWHLNYSESDQNSDELAKVGAGVENHQPLNYMNLDGHGYQEYYWSHFVFPNYFLSNDALLDTQLSPKRSQFFFFEYYVRKMGYCKKIIMIL